jgi:hypothetical protein
MKKENKEYLTKLLMFSQHQYTQEKKEKKLYFGLYLTN